ncbi:ANE_G0040460.mRNA.1.CDS.1 [Saccharomyces cerevisiae]|nr:ANE_G0040460.mRNA.1.CDS.1 [Saccharomyces cerevisiae]CAI6834265.1 ANE_G0040460.mRNA.1.CDS.1 [Saccharomyces cerevisiae]
MVQNDIGSSCPEILKVVLLSLIPINWVEKLSFGQGKTGSCSAIDPKSDKDEYDRCVNDLMTTNNPPMNSLFKDAEPPLF